MSDKNNELKHAYLYKGLTAFFVIAAAILFYFFILRISALTGFFGRVISVLQPIILGIVIAYLINPIVNFLNARLIPFFKKRMKNPKKAVKLSNCISVIVSEALFCVFVFGFLAIVIPEFAKSVAGIVNTLPEKLEEYGKKGIKLINSNNTLKQAYKMAIEYGENWIQNDLETFAKNLTSSVAQGILGVANFLKDFIIGIIVSIYIMLSKRLFVNQTKKLCYAVFKEKTVNRIFDWFSKSHRIFSGFINGKLLDSLIIGVICFIGTSILNIPYALLISCIIGVTNIIPVFGPWIGGIPSTVLVLLIDPWKGLYLGIFIILLQLLDGNIIGPKILGNRVGINTFWVVFAIVLGGGLFGVIGMLIGVPGFAIIYYVIATVINYLLRRKNKSQNSADYAFTNGDIKCEKSLSDENGGKTVEKAETD